MREAAIDTLVIQNALRQALEDKDFPVFYQPIYSGTCEHLVGVEALVRWNHATMGIISPMPLSRLPKTSGSFMSWGLGHASGL